MNDQQQRAARPSIADTMQSTEGVLRQAGRDFLLDLYATLRNLKMYPVENEQVQRSLDELSGSANALLGIEQELEVRVQGEFIFVNGTRLRLSLDNFASFSHILSTLRHSGIGTVQVDENVERKEWQIFVSLLLTFAARDASPNKLSELQGKMQQGGITRIHVEAPPE
ncbi:MAG: hypothetical protein PVF27_03125, partial [Gemmatimonadales bacterium]